MRAGGGISGVRIGGGNWVGGVVGQFGESCEVGGRPRSSMMMVSLDTDLVLERLGERWIGCAGDHSDAGSVGVAGDWEP